MSPGRYSPPSFSFGGPLTPAVRWIIIATVAVYVLEFFGALGDSLVRYLALTPALVLGHGFVWQLATYMLVHVAHPVHIVFNMLAVWMFGGAIEANWGTRRFTWYYLGTGIAAGVCVVLAALFAGGPGDLRAMTLGSSGAVFGLLVAFGMLFPEDRVIFIVFPMRAKHMVMLLIAMEFFILLGNTSSSTSPVAHLGGALAGWLYLKFSWRIGNWYQATFGPRSRFKVVPQEPRAPRRPVGRDQAPSIPVAPAPRTVEPSRPRVSAEEAMIQKRADEILDKIAREGMGSLTREERSILNRHSQLLKQRETGVVNLDDYRG